MRKKKIIGLVFFVILSCKILLPQCGPFCPVCSGTGSSTGALISPGVLVLNMLYIPNGEEEVGVINLRGGVSSWLDLGVGYTYKAKKPIWSARIQAVNEDEDSWKPSLILGTGSVQTGKSDQSLFVMTSKSWELSEAFALRMSVGIASLISDIDKLYGLASLTFTITERFSPFISYDGINFHPGISWIPLDWLQAGFILIESKEPAVSVGIRLDFNRERP